MSTFQDRLEALCEAAGDALGPDIQRLSRLFGAERSERPPDYMADPALRRAYLAFFLPQYAAKIALLLEQKRAEGLLALPAMPRVLDIGAGPLTGLFGVWLMHGELGPSVALDLATRAMSAGHSLLEKVAPRQPVSLRTQPAQAQPLPEGPFDLVVVAHVLNELGDPRRGQPERQMLLRRLLSVLAPGGRVLVVEPATRVHGRALMAVRDALFDDSFSILSPCRGARRCPLLARPSDWCHGDLSWQRSARFAALEKASGLQKTELKQSHLLLARRGDPAVSTVGQRLVGGLMADGTGVERRYGCGSEGLVVLRGRPRLPEPVSRPLRGALLERTSSEVEELTVSLDRDGRAGSRASGGLKGRARARGTRPRR